MDIRKVADRTIADRSSVDRTAEGPERGKTVVLQPQPPLGHKAVDGDHAEISSKGRDTAAFVEGLAERARRVGSDRHEIVEAARARLASGELGTPAALDRTARNLLDSGFLAG
ncbi:MAG: hypothetical protein KDE27_22785 [Planctomycetes bacterium]|nr:hypothetical protein [Planctomycetota bacterium]